MHNSLAQNQPADPIPSLIEALGSEDGSVRQAARKQLVVIGSPAVAALSEALTDCNDHVRWESAKALGNILDPSAIPALVKAMEDKNVDVRWVAADSLINFKQNAVSQILIRLVNNFDTLWLREGSRYVFRQLKKRTGLDDPTAKVLETLDGPAPEAEVAWSAKSALEKMHIDWKKEIRSKIGAGQTQTDLPLGAEVNCSDGQCGKIARVIVNPASGTITHLVVKGRKNPRLEHLVPVEMIASSTPAAVFLLCNTSELEEMQPFKRKQIRPDELDIRSGARVIATDGEVGQVDEFLIDPRDNKITHLILREGHKWDEVDITVPAAQIDCIDEKGVYLKIDKCAIGFLPSVPLQRRKQKQE